MLRRGGELDGARILGPRTIAMMHKNHLKDGRDLTQMAIGGFSETANVGVGFGLGFAMTLDEVTTGVLGEGDYYWGGAASTIFWVDPEGGPLRGLHDPADALRRLQLPRPAEEHHLFGDRGLRVSKSHVPPALRRGGPLDSNGSGLGREWRVTANLDLRRSMDPEHKAGGTADMGGFSRNPRAEPVEASRISGLQTLAAPHSLQPRMRGVPGRNMLCQVSVLNPAASIAAPIGRVR